MFPDMKTQGTAYKELQAWVDRTAALCTPKNVVWCDGSQEEWDTLTQQLCDQGTFTRLEEDDE